MGIDRRRGQVSPPADGSYRDPALVGKTSASEGEVYRKSPVGTKDISDINYTPNGNVYENPGIYQVDLTYIDGGQYERPKEYEPPPTPPTFIESTIYPPFWQDDFYLDTRLKTSYLWPHSDTLNLVGQMTGGTLSSLLQQYTNWPAETMNLVGQMTSGSIVTLLISYSNWPSETINLVGGQITSGTLLSFLVSYSNWPSETMYIASNMITGGTLA